MKMHLFVQSYEMQMKSTQIQMKVEYLHVQNKIQMKVEHLCAHDQDAKRFQLSGP